MKIARILRKRCASCMLLGAVLAAANGPLTATADAETMVGKLYWTLFVGDVYRANLDGSNQEVAYLKRTGGGYPFAVDRRQQEIYVQSIRNGGFTRFDYDGQNAELAFDFAGNINAIAVDDVNGKLYWKNSSDPVRLWRASLDGSELEVLADGLGRVEDIEVDPVRGYYYWQDNLVHGFHREAIDGSGGSLIDYGDELGIPAFVPTINDISIDPVDGRLYIADDTGDGMIVSVGPDGADPALLSIDEVVNPFAIAVDPIGRRVYWSNTETIISGPTEYDYFVMSANLDGTDVRKEFSVGQFVNVPLKLAVVHVPVPEPANFTLAALGGGALYAAQRRCVCRWPVRRRCPRSIGRFVRRCRRLQ